MKHSYKLLVALIITAFLGACNDNTQSPTNVTTPQGEDPSGGKWKTVVLSSGNAIVLPHHSAINSDQFNKEIKEIIDIQSNLTQQMRDSINYWNTGAVVCWNEIARSLVIKYKTNPPMASRVYALLSVAQYDALVSAWFNKYKYNIKSPADYNTGVKKLVTVSPTPAYPSDHAVVAYVSKNILSYLYPDETAHLQSLLGSHLLSRLCAGVSTREDIDAASTIGAQVAAAVIEMAKSDNSNLKWTGTVPTGDGMWFSSENPPAAPLLPRWSEVRPWLIPSVESMACPPPPVFNSPAFKAALLEVRWFADNRTAEQNRIALFWSDGGGTYTPPGHWNEIASSLIKENQLNELEAARALSLMNMAIMDAGICCWYAKYQYWYIRPSQVDTAINLAVPLPNFPSYSSGHATFSGAASTVLGYIFPGKLAELTDMANEAAMSRIYGGIHYRFDSDEGLKNGRHVGQYAIIRGQSDGSGL